MKRRKRIGKVLILVFLGLFMVSCAEQYPPPENAIIECIKSDRYPEYKSTNSGTYFYCGNGKYNK